MKTISTIEVDGTHHPLEYDTVTHLFTVQVRDQVVRSVSEDSLVEQVRHALRPRRFPNEFPIGTVLAFKKSFPGGTRPVGGAYGYVALRAANGKWYLTASAPGRMSSPVTWETLIGFIGDGACSIARTWDDVPQQGTSDIGTPYVTAARSMRRRYFSDAPEW